MRLTWRDEQATADWCQQLAARMRGQPPLRHGFIALSGDLGAGKTTLVRHLLRALGVTGRVKSPTYALVEPYEIALASDTADAQPWPLWHFDFYRIEHPREVEESGLLEVLAGPGLKLAEWPEKAAGVLPVADLDIELLADADDRRVVTLRAHSDVGRAWLA